MGGISASGDAEDEVLTGETGETDNNTIRYR